MKAIQFGRIAVLGLIVAASSCTSAVRQGTGTSFLIIGALEGASGAEPNKFGGTLYSDVITVVDDVPSIYADLGRARFTLGLKDPGSATSPSSPTQNQFITLERYRVTYTRTDGRNTPGVDVPYGFDAGLTLTIGEGSAEGAFEIVRHIAKKEAPLAALQSSPVIISTIAEVTFFGHDQTGHEVTAVGRVSIDFGNFADPDQ